MVFALLRPEANKDNNNNNNNNNHNHYHNHNHNNNNDNRNDKVENCRNIKGKTDKKDNTVTRTTITIMTMTPLAK